MPVTIKEKDGSVIFMMSGTKITVFPLTMDKLSITFNVPDQYQNQLLKVMYADDCNSMYQKAFSFSVTRKWLPYAPSAMVSTTTARLQAGPKSSVYGSAKMKFGRLTFTPSKVTDIAELRSKVNQVMPVGFGWDHIMATGIVTRMDLAIDIVNVQIDDLLFVHGKTKITEVNTKSGRTEYLGGKYKSGKLVALYDKTAQIKTNNAKAVFSKDKEPVPDFPVTRLEIRLDQNAYGFKKMLVSQLFQLKNPFPNLMVASIHHQANSSLEAWVWDVFLRLARYEGAHAADIGLEMS
ncbi:MAG: hypothetical protein HQL77_05800 [Magnetococcales bacterium]|nr:hypothetical protein [Magnetococcales bacterium]